MLVNRFSWLWVNVYVEVFTPTLLQNPVTHLANYEWYELWQQPYAYATSGLRFRKFQMFDFCCNLYGSSKEKWQIQRALPCEAMLTHNQHWSASQNVVYVAELVSTVAGTREQQGWHPKDVALWQRALVVSGGWQGVGPVTGGQSSPQWHQSTSPSRGPAHSQQFLN